MKILAIIGILCSAFTAIEFINTDDILYMRVFGCLSYCLLMAFLIDSYRGFK